MVVIIKSGGFKFGRLDCNYLFDVSYLVDLGFTDFGVAMGDPIRVGAGNSAPIWP